MSKRANLITAAALTFAAAFATPSIAAPSGGGAISEPQPRQQVNPEQSYKDGIEALQNGDYKLAEKKFGEVLSVASDHPEANYYMGLAKVRREKEKSAVRYFKKAIKERENFVEAREQLAIVYTGLEKPEEAEEQLTALREIKEACTEETCDAEFVERTERAIANVEAALSGASEVSTLRTIAPVHAQLGNQTDASADMRYGEAVRLINQSRYEEAIALLYVAHGLTGPHPDILNYLGYSHRKLDLFDKAQAYYATALRIDPDHLGANEYLGELYLEIGELEKARRQLAKLDRVCEFGCAEREDLARLIEIKESTRTAVVE